MGRLKIVDARFRSAEEVASVIADAHVLLQRLQTEIKGLEKRRDLWATIDSRGEFIRDGAPTFEHSAEWLHRANVELELKARERDDLNMWVFGLNKLAKVFEREPKTSAAPQ